MIEEDIAVYYTALTSLAPNIISTASLIVLLSALAFSADFTQRDKERIIAMKNYTCESCGKSFNAKTYKGNLEVHHMLPESWGGVPSDANAVVLCRNCHDRIDKLTFRSRILYNGVSLEQVQEHCRELIGDPKTYYSTLQRLKLNL